MKNFFSDIWSREVEEVTIQLDKMKLATVTVNRQRTFPPLILQIHLGMDCGQKGRQLPKSKTALDEHYCFEGRQVQQTKALVQRNQLHSTKVAQAKNTIIIKKSWTTENGFNTSRR
jgi:hypothetical protein